jgi:hypothetical protein
LQVHSILERLKPTVRCGPDPKQADSAQRGATWMTVGHMLQWAALLSLIGACAWARELVERCRKTKQF